MYVRRSISVAQCVSFFYWLLLRRPFGKTDAERVPQRLRPESTDAHLGRPQPAQLRHQDRQVREGTLIDANAVLSSSSSLLLSLTLLVVVLVVMFFCSLWATRWTIVETHAVSPDRETPTELCSCLVF